MLALSTETTDVVSTWVRPASCLLLVVGAWFIAGQPARLGSYAALLVAGAAASGMLGLGAAQWLVAALLLIALAAKPRPHQRAIRSCIALLGCLVVIATVYRAV